MTTCQVEIVTTVCCVFLPHGGGGGGGGSLEYRLEIAPITSTQSRIICSYHNSFIEMSSVFSIEGPIAIKSNQIKSNQIKIIGLF